MSKNLLPNFIVGGFPKSGTSSLYSYLSQHPDVCGCAKKEPKYFWPLVYDREPESLDSYKSLFDHCDINAKIRFEASAKYIYGGRKVAQGIKDTIGENIKILFIVREPIAQLLSIFKYKKYCLVIPKETSFYEYTKNSLEHGSKELFQESDQLYDVIEHGKYHHYLSQWFEVFDDNVRVVFFDDLKKDPIKLLGDIGDWIGIEKEAFKSVNLNPDNVSTNVKNTAFHKFARYAFHGFEEFWRMNPKFKNFSRDLYHKVNGEKHSDKIDDKTRGLLANKYDDEKTKLRELLSNRGYTNLPTWL
ncbi:MAG: hypothetical protein HKN92_00020 [Chitinophagales bacterium]|nr:hypothetical protein [Chitinophagales bacterium]